MPITPDGTAILIVALTLLALVIAAGVFLYHDAQPTEGAGQDPQAGDLITEWVLIPPGQIGNAGWRLELLDRLEQRAHAHGLTLATELELKTQELGEDDLARWRWRLGRILPPGTTIGLLEGKLEP